MKDLVVGQNARCPKWGWLPLHFFLEGLLGVNRSIGVLTHSHFASEFASQSLPRRRGVPQRHAGRPLLAPLPAGPLRRPRRGLRRRPGGGAFRGGWGVREVGGWIEGTCGAFVFLLFWLVYFQRKIERTPSTSIFCPLMVLNTWWLPLCSDVPWI